MSAVRTARLVKATALVPLTVLSVAWTVSIAGVGGPMLAGTAAPQPAAGVLPDGTSVPSQAIEAPASVSDQASLGDGTHASQIVSSASTSAIPSAALAAYQRAETVINAADTTCKLPWQLVAAIGRVESNHGRFGGSTLDDNGVATPGIVGVALDGTNATALINDTDAGQYDNDTTFDRAIGPMQFIPSTWSVVGVDADGDGTRNPQDVDDAALGTAVYLCSGEDDLSTEAGQRAAVFRYNRSESYVDLVISIMAAYTAGDFTTIPNSTVAAGQLVSAPQPLAPVRTKSAQDKLAGGDQKSTAGTGTKAAPTPSPTPTPAPAPPKPPADPVTNGKDGGVSVDKPAGGGPQGGVPPLPAPSVAPVDQVMTTAQAVAQCTVEGFVDTLQSNDAFDTCVTGYSTP
ncbi:MAG: lytic murein transglycosylase [Nocardioides sp.]|nr:lytic murein transglycosylase [Nocardioides sp.]